MLQCKVNKVINKGFNKLYLAYGITAKVGPA